MADQVDLAPNAVQEDAGRMAWWTDLDVGIQSALIGVGGALIGAVVGGLMASRAARQASERQWRREDEARSRQRREQQMQDLMTAWAKLHRAANAGTWEYTYLVDDEHAGPEERRRQLVLFAEFWRHCKYVALLSRSAGYPAAARFLYELHHFEDDIANADARYETAMKIAEHYLEHPDEIEAKLAPDPEGAAAEMVDIVSRHRQEPDS